MKFQNKSAIYLQIADHICEKILAGNWQAQNKIPSIREMAIIIEVNPNTVVRTYNYLEAKQIIYKQRGIGFFVSPKAYQNVLQLKKKAFIKEELPKLFKNMELLKMEFTELQNLYKQYKKPRGHHENQQ